MMEEDSSLSQLGDQSNFIVLPSQDETQQSLQTDHKMAEYLKKLPALQFADAGTSKLSLDVPSDTTEELKKSKVLVQDSEYDSERPVEHTETTDYVSESEEESHGPNEDTSEDHGEVTVIQKASTGTEGLVIPADKEKAEGSKSSSESSFHSKNRSNLGSYDQCELYKTQSGHAKGARFNPFAASQEDMFAAEDDHGQPVSTPAEHLGSLHLSQKPMLVPETLDDCGNEISPSPDVYGSTPIIIPSSPTQNSQGYGDEASMFDVNAANTLAENSKGFDFGDSSDKENSSGSKRSKTPDPESASFRKSPIDIDLQMSTLADDNKVEQGKSKRDKSTKPSEKQQKSSGEKEAMERSDSPILASMESVRPASCMQDEEVIVIPSGTMETQPDDQSQQLFLHLTPSQNGTTQGQRSQGKLSLGLGESVDIRSQGHLQAYSAGAITIEDESADVERESLKQNKKDSKEVGSQHFSKNSQKVGGSSQGQLEVMVEEVQGFRNKSQGEGSEGQRSNRSSQRSNRSGSQKSERSQRRKRDEKVLAEVNDNPLVVWKSESDTDQFHLTLPKEGSLLHPAETVGNQVEGQVTGENEGEAANSGEKVLQAGQRDSILSEESHREEVLAIGAIQFESEPVTQPSFRLQKPAGLEDTEVSQEATEDFVSRNISPRQIRPKTRYILEDDSDEEVVVPSLAKQKEAGPQAHDETTEKAGPSHELDEATEEVYVAQKLQLTMPDESVDATQPYDPKQELTTHSVVTEASNNNTEKTSVALTTAGEPVKGSDTSQPVIQVDHSVLVQSSTQTLEEPGVAGARMEVDMNVVQKVAEYLQSGLSSRSRSSSSCTDLSDLQGSEKGELKNVTPKRRERQRSSASSLGRRESMDRVSPKSPKEIQNIINTYSSILSKAKGKLPTSPSVPTLQRELSLTESVKSFKDSKESAVETVTPTRPALVRRDSNNSVSATKTAVAGDKTKGEGHLLPGPPRVAASTVKKASNQQYGGSENNGFSPIPEVVSPESHLEEEKVIETTPAVKSQSVAKETITGSSPVPTVSKETKGDSMRTPSDKTSHSHNKPTYSKDKHSTGKHRVRRRLSPSERMERRRSLDSASPRVPTAGFVASTQKFSAGSTPTYSSHGTKLHRGDTFEFHGTQSQISPEEASSSRHKDLRKASSPPNYAERTPLSSRKRSRLQHRKSGLKKSKSEEPISPHVTPGKPHVSFKNSSNESHDRPISQKSNVTTATVGSLQSLPSSISSPSSRENIMSPSSTSSGSRQSLRGEFSARLSGKRLSIEPALPDTIPLPPVDEENYQLVTEETHVVRTVYDEVTTTKRLIGPQGQVLESSVDVCKKEPRIMEESTHKRMRYVFIASPSRSGTSLTSGDLADISSSLSRSSVSSGSLRSKGNTINGTSSSSMEVGSMEHQTSGQHTDSFPKSQNVTGVDKHVTMETSEFEKSQERPGTSASWAGNQGPAVLKADLQKPQTPVRPATVTPNLPEVSVVITPLGSPINKTGSSYLHSRTVSMESPRTSDSLFTTPEDRRARRTTDRERVGALPEDPIRHTEKQSSSSEDSQQTKPPTSSNDDVSSEIPQQDQAVSSSSPNGESGLVPSSGVVGCRVIAKWKDGFFYPGSLKSSTDRNGKCQVSFDDGDSMYVKIPDILLVERLPVGQSVMVMSEEGDFESGMISALQEQHYMVNRDEGGTGRFSHSQVILSADQASCIISDAGSEILLHQTGLPGPAAQSGAVSLDNLVDNPRRSSKKQPRDPKGIPEEGGSQPPSSSRGRKRKMEELMPKATSTPTPKGKVAMAGKRRRVMDVDESPIETPQSSPVTARKSPRKARDRLFKKDVGPLPSKKLFRGCTFLLTNVEKSREQQEFEQKLLQDSSLEISSGESATEEDNSAPFDKDHLKAQIEAGGGVCLDTLDEKLVGKKKVYLLSSSFQRTIKYLQCLACGIPCVSHMWLVDSCSQGQLLDERSYMLPTGVSLEKRKMMEWRGKRDTFIGVKAAVFSKNAKFVESWTNILKLGGCSVNKQLQYSEIHVIVTDSSCTAAVKRQAASHAIPLVSMEWVIQSLVNSKTVTYDGHERYKHDFTT